MLIESSLHAKSVVAKAVLRTFTSEVLNRSECIHVRRIVRIVRESERYKNEFTKTSSTGLSKRFLVSTGRRPHRLETLFIHYPLTVFVRHYGPVESRTVYQLRGLTAEKKQLGRCAGRVNKRTFVRNCKGRYGSNIDRESRFGNEMPANRVVMAFLIC